MQAPTHVLTGVLIEKSFGRVRFPWLRIALIVITALFMHSVFDRLARLTYHPPEPDFKSTFWVGYHLLVAAGFIVSLYYFWRPFKLGIIFSILPDFDWVIIHGQEILGINIGYSKPWIHEIIHHVADRVPPFSFLQYLPDLTHIPAAVLFELFIVVSLLYIILYEPLLWSNAETDEMGVEEEEE